MNQFESRAGIKTTGGNINTCQSDVGINDVRVCFVSLVDTRAKSFKVNANSKIKTRLCHQISGPTAFDVGFSTKKHLTTVCVWTYQWSIMDKCVWFLLSFFACMNATSNLSILPYNWDSYSQQKDDFVQFDWWYWSRHYLCAGNLMYYSIHVPRWLLKWLNLITAHSSVSNEPGSVTWLATNYLKTVSWRNHTEILTTLWHQNIILAKNQHSSFIFNYFDVNCLENTLKLLFDSYVTAIKFLTWLVFKTWLDLIPILLESVKILGWNTVKLLTGMQTTIHSLASCTENFPLIQISSILSVTFTNLWHRYQIVFQWTNCSSASYAGSSDCLMTSLILMTMDNSRGHCAYWQSCKVPNQSHSVKKGKTYAIKQIKICAEYRDMLPRPWLGTCQVHLVPDKPALACVACPGILHRS